MARPLFQRVIKQGNSLAVILPVEITRGLEIQRGDLISVSVVSAQQVVLELFTASEEEALKRKSKLPPDETIEY